MKGAKDREKGEDWGAAPPFPPLPKGPRLVLHSYLQQQAATQFILFGRTTSSSLRKIKTVPIFTLLFGWGEACRAGSHFFLN